LFREGEEVYFFDKLDYAIESHNLSTGKRENFGNFNDMLDLKTSLIDCVMLAVNKEKNKLFYSIKNQPFIKSIEFKTLKVIDEVDLSHHYKKHPNIDPFTFSKMSVYNDHSVDSDPN